MSGKLLNVLCAALASMQKPLNQQQPKKVSVSAVWSERCLHTYSLNDADTNPSAVSASQSKAGVGKHFNWKATMDSEIQQRDWQLRLEQKGKVYHGIFRKK